jgi:ribosomal protein L29
MAKKTDNFKGMKQEELEKKLAVLQEESRAKRFKVEGAKSKNVKEASTLRKQIARVLTEMNKNNNNKK